MIFGDNNKNQYSVESSGGTSFLDNYYKRKKPRSKGLKTSIDIPKININGCNQGYSINEEEEDSVGNVRNFEFDQANQSNHNDSNLDLSKDAFIKRK